MKKGWKGCLTINKKQVMDYLEIAKLKEANIFVYFICIPDGKMYKLTQENLKKPTSTERDRDGKEFFLYDKENLEILMDNMPEAIFNSDVLYQKTG